MELQEAYQKAFELRCDGRYVEARAQIQRILAIDPSHAEGLWQLGLIQGFEGDFEESLATLSSLVDRYPARNDFRYDLAMTQTMLGMQEEACDNFRAILATDPSHEKARQQAIYCD